MDVKIGEYSMEKDFSLSLLSVEIGKVEVDEDLQEVKGRNGSIDATEALTGFPTYKNRTITFSFDFKDGNYDLWLIKSSSLMNAIHGKRLPVIIGRDDHYFDGRVSVNSDKLNKYYSKITIEVNADPYKYDLYSSLEDWKWDPFNFETGVIREYKDLQVDGTLILHIPGSALKVSPVFECSADMVLRYKEITYKLPAGKSSSPDLLLRDDDNILTFFGTGTISVDYRGGSF